MIERFVQRFDAARADLRTGFREKPPESYSEIVERVIRVLGVEDDNDYTPDPERITRIDHGHYQGTIVFVIGAQGYQPDVYWYVRMAYGSCGGCDAFQSAMDASDYDYDSNKLIMSESTLSMLMALALHVVQRMKQMDDE
jgi:hypothetical protein